MNKDIAENFYNLANEWTVEIIYRLADHFNTSVDVVLQVFDKADY